jgi:hypothetical protein
MNYIRRTGYCVVMGLLAVASAIAACAPGGEAGGADEGVSSRGQTICNNDCDPGGDDDDDLPGGGGGTPTAYPIITFWEGNDCQQDQVGWFGATQLKAENPPSPAITIPNTGGSGWENDEARSMRLFHIPEGTRFKVCNSPSCSTNESWAVIRVVKNITDRCVYSFQFNYSPNQDEYVIDELHGSGLDGAVSRVEVYRW